MTSAGRLGQIRGARHLRAWAPAGVCSRPDHQVGELLARSTWSRFSWRHAASRSRGILARSGAWSCASRRERRCWRPPAHRAAVLRIESGRRTRTAGEWVTRPPSSALLGVAVGASHGAQLSGDVVAVRTQASSSRPKVSMSLLRTSKRTRWMRSHKAVATEGGVIEGHELAEVQGVRFAGRAPVAVEAPGEC